MSTTTFASPRPSLQLPRDVFDALIMLEQATRDAATFYAENNTDDPAHPETAVEYLELVVEAGARRDALAELLLPRLAGVVAVPLVGEAS